jgi:hypothetical protein
VADMGGGGHGALPARRSGDANSTPFAFKGT